MENLILIIETSLIIGLIVGFFIWKEITKKKKKSSEIKAKEILLEAHNKAIKLIEEAKREVEDRRREALKFERRIENKESEIQEKEKNLSFQIEKIRKIKEEITQAKELEIEKLEKISGLNQKEAERKILNLFEKKTRGEILNRIREIEKEGKEKIEEKVKDTVALAVERCNIPQAVERTMTTITLPSEEMKGRVIGREGRNIRTFEQITGVEVLIDDTPDTITLSCFSSYRREVAKIALEKLLADGRIQPTKIEETVEYAKRELTEETKKIGEEAAYEAGVSGLSPAIFPFLGRLKFRTSYGQNALIHSKEVALLASSLGEELGANVGICKRGGLLHDLGKSIDREIEGTHPRIGAELVKKFNISPEVIHCIEAHHEDIPYKSIEAIIVHVADALSGARPGARKETYEQYLQRIEEIEQVADSFDGVKESYAIQAGREIRVFVEPEKVDDLEMVKLASRITEKIERELKYPGEIKVNIIRETRAVEYAR